MRIVKPVSPFARAPNDTNSITVISTTTRTGRGKVQLFVILFLINLAAIAQTNPGRISGSMLEPPGRSPGTSDRAHPPQLSGTVDDTSGAVIAGATVLVRSEDGTVQRTAQ